MMKRHLIYLIGAILAAASFGCSEEEIASNDGTELTIELTVASDMNTRTQRELESVNNWQHVTDVRVYVFHSTTPDGTFTLYQPTLKDDEGAEQTLEYIDVKAFNKTEIHKEKEFEKHYVVIKPQLPEGYYRLLAVGVDEYTALFNVITPESTWDDIIKTTEDTPITSEFFSGKSETIHITSQLSSTFISIELKRCVAGVLIYVKNIQSINGKKIDNIKLMLSGFSKNTDIVNRSWASDADGDYIELAAIKAETTPNDTIDGEKCYYTGRFLLPSNTGKLDNPTMKMVFYSGDVEVDAKNVKLVNASDDDYDTPNLNEKGTCYNIIANRLYCIGFRSKEIKEPVDLNKKDIEAKIISYGSWQADVNIPL